MTPAQQRAVASIRTELSRLIRYDDESIVNDLWLRPRYDSGHFATLGDARRASVVTAWSDSARSMVSLASS